MNSSVTTDSVLTLEDLEKTTYEIPPMQPDNIAIWVTPDEYKKIKAGTSIYNELGIV